jgi:hypothetical protein
MRSGILASILLVSASLTAEAPLPASIGAATMTPDGTITLRLRAAGPGGMIGEGNLTYRRGSPQYDEVLQHLGGLKPGETKPVPPWRN